VRKRGKKEKKGGARKWLGFFGGPLDGRD